jgi:hypothetical protein
VSIAGVICYVKAGSLKFSFCLLRFSRRSGLLSKTNLTRSTSVSRMLAMAFMTVSFLLKQTHSNSQAANSGDIIGVPSLRTWVRLSQTRTLLSLFT